MMVMNQQNTGDPEPQGLDVLNHLIEMTEARLVDLIDRMRDPVVYEESIIEAMRGIVFVEGALGRLIEERNLLTPSELSA